jgi:hypothetical protein
MNVWKPCSEVLSRNKKPEPPVTWKFNMKKAGKRNQALALPPRFIQRYGVSISILTASICMADCVKSLTNKPLEANVLVNSPASFEALESD